ncbi:MAG: hypothetical protein ACO38Q_03540 [Aquiluna sp.]
MTYGLPDSMTYTMGRRVLRVVRDRGAQAADRLEGDYEVIDAMVTTVINVVTWALLIPLYIIAAPFILINWVSDRRAKKRAEMDKADRYRRYLEKKAQK